MKDRDNNVNKWQIRMEARHTVCKKSDFFIVMKEITCLCPTYQMNNAFKKTMQTHKKLLHDAYKLFKRKFKFNASDCFYMYVFGDGICNVG